MTYLQQLTSCLTTGLWTLDQLGALDRIDSAAAGAYARALERPGGGFTGGLWDEGVDVEYTFTDWAYLLWLPDETPATTNPVQQGQLYTCANG
jgi:hypothetical protein